MIYMNNLTEDLLSEFKPKALLAIYGKNYNDYYMESHKIMNNGGIGPGVPVSYDTIAEMVSIFHKEENKASKVSGLFPTTLIHFEQKTRGKYKMIWYNKEFRRPLFFKPETKLKSTDYNLPASIFVVDDNKLSVFCYNNRKVTEQTELLMPVWYNTSDNGDMCLGNAKTKLKQLTYAGLIEYWETLFYDSYFSHVNGEEKCKSKELKKAWKKATEFEFDWKTELIPYKDKTYLKDLL
jgi:PRTRC genetic system protein B